jgi:hypothetical protein
MTDDDDKEERRLERLAKAGISPEEWADLQEQRRMGHAHLDATEAHKRFEALNDVAASERFEAIPRVKMLLEDDAPVVSHGPHAFVFQVGVHAASVLQHLYRRGERAVDFGPVRVLRGLPVTEVEASATNALASLSEEARRSLLLQVDADVAERIRPPKRDESAVRAYRVLQRLDLVRPELQHVDPTTYLTPLQEEIYASQTRHPPPAPHIRIGTAEPARTLGWITGGADGRLQIVVSEHPLARAAKEEFEWFASGSDAHLREVAAFLVKRGYVAELTE